MENVSTGVLDENTEHYLRCREKAEKSCDVLRHVQLHMSKYKKNEEKNPVCQTYSPTSCCLKVDFQKVDQDTAGKWLIHDTNAARTINCKAWNSPVEYPSWVARCDIKGSDGTMLTLIFLQKVQRQNILGGERLQNAKSLVSNCCLKQIPVVISILVFVYLS